MPLRVINSILAGLLSVLALAQGYTVEVSGHISNCNPAIADGFVVIQTVQNTQPPITVEVPLNENCYYHTAFYMSSSSGWFQVTGSCADGTSATSTGQYESIPFLDSAFVIIDLNCEGLPDCFGIPNGTAQEDDCGVCYEGGMINPLWNTTCADCAGVPNGTAFIDDCDACVGGTTGELPCGDDCAGVPGGTAYIDNCGDCVGGTTGEEPCGADCNGDFGGTAFLDNCGDCVSGNTGEEPCEADCEGVFGGNALPGTPCEVPEPGIWSSDCVCDPTGPQFDCPALEANIGDPCDDGNFFTQQDTVTPNCECVGQPGSGQYTITIQGTVDPCTQAIADGVVVIQSVGVQPPINSTAQLDDSCSYSVTFTVTSPSGLFAVAASCMDGTMATATGEYSFNMPIGDSTIVADLDCMNNVEPDCLGIPGGAALPGTPCDDENPFTINDTWSNECECAGIEPGFCEAGFWVIQGYENDPNNGPQPTPYELWVWNLSTGSGNYQFLWDFGDGNSSTQAFPTHVYGGPGPYVLCLTISDDSGCTDTYCDSISVDEDGMYNGMWTGGNDRNVLTIHVQQSDPSSINEAAWHEVLSIWPNPASELLNISTGASITGNTMVSIIDMNGRLLRTMSRTFHRGTNMITIPVGDLAEGMYMVRIDNGGTSITQRFVRNQ